MSDGAISKDAMLSGLRDIRLPSDAPGGLLADATAAACFATIAALLTVALLRVVSRKKTRPHTASADPKALSHLPEDARRIALLHLLKTRAPDRYAALRPSLYRPGSPLDIATLEAEVARHA